MDTKIKSVLGSVLVIGIVAAMMTAGTQSWYSDTETSVGNTFTAGTLDLTVNGGDDPITCLFSADNMAPGHTYNAGTITLRNNGSIPGRLTVKVSNPVSHENGLMEPEITDGDLPGVEIDPTGYDANAGDGELWDECAMKLYFDMNSDGIMQWNEPLIYDGPTGLDMTAYYSIPLDTNLWTPNHGFDGILDPGETVDLGIYIKFFNDQASPMTSQPQYTGLTNNMAMSDDMQFDLIIGLEQV